MNTVKIDMFLGQGESKGQIEGELTVPAERGDMEKIHNVSCNLNVREKSIGNESIHIDGEAEFSLCYITNQGEMDSFNASAPFSHDIEAKGIDDECNVSVVFSLDDITATITDPRTAKANATVNFNADIVRPTLVPDMNTPDLQIKCISTSSKRLEHSETHSFHISDEVRIPGGMDQIDTINTTKSYGVINGIKKEGEKAICYGDICVNTIYSSPSGIWQLCDSFPFEEIIDTGINLENKEIIGDICVKKITATAYDPDVISYSAAVTISLDIYSGMPCGLVVDAYSLTHRLSLSKKHINMRSPMVRDFTKYTMRTSTDAGDIVNPVCIMALPYVKEQYAMDGTLIMEGSIICDIVHKKEDGSLDCARVQLPMDETVPVAAIKEDYEVRAVPNIQKASVIISGDEMEVRCLMDIGITAYMQEEYEIIESVEEQEEIDTCTSSMMIYFKDDDEDLFEIARKYHIPVSDINTSNENKLILMNPRI